MIRVFATLALIAAVLIGADRLLAARGPRTDHAPELVRLADLMREGDKVVAGLSLDLDRGQERHLYARSRGQWRCLSAWGAPCDGQRVEALVLGLLGARGVVLDRSGQQAASFGLEGAQFLEIALHGKALLDDPEGDELLRVRFAGADSPFARVSARPGVLELDFRPAALSSRSAQALPPLLDARIYPGVFPEQGRRVERLFVERADGPAFELVRRPREPDEQPDPADPASSLDWEWLLIEGERQVVLSPLRGEAFVTWIPRAPYVALADPASAAERGLAEPRAKLTLVPDEGPTLELELGAILPEGGFWVRAPSVPLLARVDAQSAGMLLPELEELTDDSRDNRWDLALRKAMEQGGQR